MSQHSDQAADGQSTSGSSEAKTDRYGFLLVNEDINNDSSDDPCPELVRHREMKWINFMSQWDQMLEKKHSKIKAQCQKGIPASVRSKCWPLLCGATQRKQSNKDLYKTLEASPGQQSWIDVIKRDTDRQFPFHEMFQSKDSHGQQGLLQVLKVYTQFRPDEGYCQAQGPVAAVLLMHMPMEEAFWCLVQISELYLPGYYSPLLEGVLFDAAILFAVLKRTCPAAYKHMQKQGVEPLMFATDWLMCLYTRHLPFNTLLRVWDLFFCNGVRVLFQVAVVLVRRCLGEARQRKECDGQMETLERLRSVKGQIQQEQADAFIQEVSSVPLSLAELQRHTEKELEKWKKERPGSTFDPRDRCHGYYMIWEKGKEREKENERRERKSGNLRAPVMRSHSSLSPAILRKKWRKRGSKTEADEREGKRFPEQDGDEDDRRRASVCGVAGELRPKTQEFSTHRQNERNAVTNVRRVSATETHVGADGNAGVFEEEEENDGVAIAIPSHTAGGDHEEETRVSTNLGEGNDPQTANVQQETGNRHETEKRVEKKQQDDQNKDIPTHQHQPEAQTQQEEAQFQTMTQADDAGNEQETHGIQSKQEEETACKPKEEEQLNTSACEEEVGIIQPEVSLEVNTDAQQKQTSEHDEEMETGSSKREVEIHLGSTDQEATYNRDTQEKEIETNGSEHEVETQEGMETKSKTCRQEVVQEIKTDSREQEGNTPDAEEEKEDKEQEIEIQGANDSKENSSEQEVEMQEEREKMANKGEQEMEIQEEKGIKVIGSEQEVEIENGKKQDEQKHTQDVGQTSQTEEEMQPNVQTPEDPKDSCESGNNTDVEKTQHEQEGEREEEVRIADAPEKETEETITEEEKRRSNNLSGDQEASKAEASSNIQPETTMEQSGESETPQDPKEEEVETRPSGANQHPQLRLRRSSSSHTSYPTILSEDTFRDPQRTIKPDSSSRTMKAEAPDVEPTNQTRHQSSNAQQTRAQTKPDKPKRRGLFQRLRADAPSKSAIPKIVIQDFSEGEEKLSAKERRRRRRMQERKEKEEEKERKKLEKEKTRERKKPQTRGKSFQVSSRRNDDDDASTARSRKRTSYSESYF